MIKKLRIQVVCVCMLMVGLVLCAVFFSAHAVVSHGLERSSQAVLQRAISEDVLNDDRSETLFDGSQVKLPYFTVEIWGGSRTAYVTGGTYSNLEDTDELRAILSACLSMEESEGYLDAYNLRYLRIETPLYQRIAFVDISAVQAAAKNLTRNFFLIATAAMAVLLVLCILLSRWITQPVERAWRQQHQFLSDASHELKTPLTVILSNAELMRSVPLEPRLERWRDNIHSEAVQMKTLVEEMLTLARADDMAPGAVFGQVDLSELATDCALAFEPVAFESGRSLDYEIEPGLTLWADPGRVRQLLAILLDNAVKYSPAGTAVTLTVQKSERWAQIRVANQGAPIPAEQLGHLFERFYRADASRGEQSGFGLGLSIADAIAKEHHGAIRAESDERSTRFICTLPLKK